MDERLRLNLERVGTFPRSSGQIGFGLRRAVGEDDVVLMESVCS